MTELSFILKLKPLSLKVKYEITDPEKRKIFEVTGPVWGQYHKPYQLIDSSEDPLMSITRPAFTFFPRFEISDNEGQLAVMKKKFGFFRRTLILETPGDKPYLIYNNYRMDDCQIARDGYTIATVRRRGFSAWRTYDISIDEEEDVELLLSMGVCIDLIYSWHHRS